jgi:tetratricopeptide (TPR) repeat protein
MRRPPKVAATGPRQAARYLRPMRMRALSLLLLLPLLALCQDMSHQERKVRKLLAKGRAYPALRVATGALGNMQQPVFYLLRSQAWNSISEYEKALADARSALRLMPDSTGGLVQLAVAEQGLGRMDSAAAHLRQALERERLPEALYLLAMVERSRGNIATARQALDQGLSTAGLGRKDSVRFLRSGGELAAQEGDTVQARVRFGQALRTDPRDPVTWNSQGFWLEAARGRHVQAIADYDRAIKLNPNYSYAFNNRGWSEYKLGDTDKALADIGRAKKRKVRNPWVWRNLGVIALESGDTAKACGHLRQALELGFTAQHGNEVETLMKEHCGGTPEKPAAPVQSPLAPVDRKEGTPPPRTNAP